MPQIAALAAPATCAYFQKLHVGRDNFFSNLDAYVFSSFGSAFFMVKFNNKVFKKIKKSENPKKIVFIFFYFIFFLKIYALFPKSVQKLFL